MRNDKQKRPKVGDLALVDPVDGYSASLRVFCPVTLRSKTIAWLPEGSPVIVLKTHASWEVWETKAFEACTGSRASFVKVLSVAGVGYTYSLNLSDTT